ncbi:MAG: hypothetical protein ACMXYK_05210, partial [Candidatus Woesearchaeota archaeon]
MKDSYVYEPSEDSFLLKQTIEKLSQYNTALEIGIGSGVISKEIVLHTKTFYGIDKNPYAIEETKETISEYLKIHKNRSHKTKIILKQGDM